MKVAVVLGLILGAFFFGLMMGKTSEPTPIPYCPTEDSCSINYDNGRWMIQEEGP